MIKTFTLNRNKNNNNRLLTGLLHYVYDDDGCIILQRVSMCVCELLHHYERLRTHTNTQKKTSKIPAIFVFRLTAAAV